MRLIILQREISTVMAIVNPEITSVFPNIFTKTAMAIIKEYPTAKDLQVTTPKKLCKIFRHIKGKTPKKLCKIFRHIKGNNFNEDKAKILIENAHNSIYSGRAKDARSLMITTNITILELILQEKALLMITTNITILELILQEKALLEYEIQKLIEQNQDDNFNNGIKAIETIPGVAQKTISAILGECGDLNRFDSAKSFIGYLGLYPTLYQSGNSSNVGRLAQRGIPIAKHALYMAAVSSVRHNIELKKIFKDKVSSGKSKKEALVIISKKIAMMIYSMFKYKQTYNPNRVLISNRK